MFLSERDEEGKFRSRTKTSTIVLMHPWATEPKGRRHTEQYHNSASRHKLARPFGLDTGQTTSRMKPTYTSNWPSSEKLPGITVIPPDRSTSASVLGKSEGNTNRPRLISATFLPYMISQLNSIGRILRGTT